MFGMETAAILPFYQRWRSNWAWLASKIHVNFQKGIQKVRFAGLPRGEEVILGSPISKHHRLKFEASPFHSDYHHTSATCLLASNLAPVSTSTTMGWEISFQLEIICDVSR